MPRLKSTNLVLVLHKFGTSPPYFWMVLAPSLSLKVGVILISQTLDHFVVDKFSSMQKRIICAYARGWLACLWKLGEILNVLKTYVKSIFPVLITYRKRGKKGNVFY